MQSTKTKSRIECLDSLRGIAAVTVIASHINLDYFYGGRTTPLKNTPLHIFYDGEAAVVFFFVLSGFVLSYKYLKEEGGGVLNKISYRQFIVSRIFRIYPLFWAVLALTAFCATHFSHSCQNIPPRDWTFWWYSHPFSMEGFTKQLSLIYTHANLVGWLSNVPGDIYIPQAWSLTIELVLSMLIPLLLIIAVRSSKWLVFFTLVSVNIFGIYPYLMHFVLGILLAKHLPRINFLLQSKSKLIKFLLLTAGLFLYSYRYSVVPYFDKVSVLQKLLFSDLSVFLIIGLGVSVIIAIVLNADRLQKILVTKPFLLVGKVSYGIYLCHTIMLTFFTPVLIHWLNQTGITNTAIILTIAFISTAAGAVLISYILHHLIELKFIALGRKVNAFMFERSKQAQFYT